MAIVNASGTVQNSYAYDVYGKPTVTGSLSNEFDFAGQQTDATGLQYLRARYMDPETGTFLSRDPLAASPSWLDRGHGYVRSNPITGTDPTGLCLDGSPECQGAGNGVTSGSPCPAGGCQINDRDGFPKPSDLEGYFFEEYVTRQGADGAWHNLRLCIAPGSGSSSSGGGRNCTGPLLGGTGVFIGEYEECGFDIAGGQVRLSCREIGTGDNARTAWTGTLDDWGGSVPQEVLAILARLAAWKYPKGARAPSPEDFEKYRCEYFSEEC
jgi:RHS repeat-associated protein